MAIVDPNGQMVYGDGGFPFSGILLGTNDGGEMVFGSGGFPFNYIFPTSTPPSSNIKTINSLVYANIKTVNGLAIASMKNFNGLS